MRELHGANFHKPGIHESGRVWANVWDVFHRMPSRGGCSRRASVGFVMCLGCGGNFSRFFLRTHTACCKYEAASCLIYLSTSTDCESCTKPIYTNPRSVEVDEYGLTRGACFVGRRLEVIAVAGLLLWISWCVLGGVDFF